IGTGVIIGGVRSGKLPQAVLDRVIPDMVQLNKVACETMLAFDVRACTDVSGFGLAGHAAEVARASRVGIRIDVTCVPCYPESMELIRQGVSTRMTPLNHDVVKDCLVIMPNVASDEEKLCYDPQTSGGLLISVSPEQAEPLLEKLRAKG